MARTENLFQTLACFFAACSDGHLSPTLGYLQFDRLRSVFTFFLSTDILPDLHIDDRFDVLFEFFFDPVLSIPALPHASIVH